MQVKEISSSNLSLWLFFVLASTVTIFSYGLRILIRSQGFVSWLEECQQSIREHSEIPRGRPIRTTYFLKWIWHRSKPGHLPLLWVLATLLPLIPIWTSALVRSIKSIITVLIVVISAFALAFFTDLIFGRTLPTRFLGGLRMWIKRQR
jgi:hypothetical protein